ncbi:MAG: hypothetical protein BWY38_03074 [Ignavibacteria bacterium ADurb.Bin266]|nr:MAG: hypothetical protein BWY38_03074 [Ignavibacteria bacterium ADurb.Bin266]
MSRQYIVVLVIIFLTNSCKEHDPCEDLVKGVYIFPELPENHGMTSQEVTEFWDLPEDICDCITTEGLIETCLNYPDLRLIMSGLNPQSGYDLLVKERFRGIRELELRPDRGTYLLKKLQKVDPLGYDPNWPASEIGAYNFDIYYLEIIFSQYVNLETLSNSERIKLIEKGIEIYKKMKEDADNYSLFGLECTTVLLGRLMYYFEFSDMVDLYNQDYQIKELIKFYGPSSIETVELVYNLSKEYLNYLKN